jgi:hypothetical protein
MRPYDLPNPDEHRPRLVELRDVDRSWATDGDALMTPQNLMAEPE